MKTPVNHHQTIRTVMRNNILFLHFLEAYCLNKFGANYGYQELGDFVSKYFNQEKVNDFLNKIPIAFGNYIKRISKTSPRTLEHSISDLFKSFMDDYASSTDYDQIDFVQPVEYHKNCESCNGNPCDC